MGLRILDGPLYSVGDLFTKRDIVLYVCIVWFIAEVSVNFTGFRRFKS